MTQQRVVKCRACGSTDAVKLRNGSKQLCRPCYESDLAARKRCRVSGCVRKSVGDYCAKHYRNIRLYGTPEPIRFAPIRYCALPGCYEIRSSYGLCRLHAGRQRKTGSTEPVRPAAGECPMCGKPFTISSVGNVPSLCQQCSRRLQHLRKTYGLSLDDYVRLHEASNWSCAICGQPQDFNAPSTKRLVVDHCHASGAVRGLLCHHCNIGIGAFRDDLILLVSATVYLQRHGKQYPPLDPAHLRMETATAT